MASSDPWHHSKDFLRTVQSFHDEFARQPSDKITEAKKLHKEYMDKIESELRKLGICTRIEYTGSTYEGTKVAKSPGNYDLEFDVMVIIDCRGSEVKVEKLPKSPGFARLRVNQAAPVGQAKTLFGEVEDGYLNAEKTARKFFGEMSKIIQACDNLRDNIKLRNHGPATQMDVSVKNTEGKNEFFYSVDVVPTYEATNKERYVSKPIKGQTNPDSLAWRQSFSIEEKTKLVAADKDNGCRKKVLRTLKVMRNRDTCLDQLTSYHLKTALFLEMDNEADWKEEKFGQRLMGVIRQLEKRLNEKNLPHYFLKREVNLLKSMQDVSIVNMEDRLKRFRNSQIEMNKVLKVKKKRNV